MNKIFNLVMAFFLLSFVGFVFAEAMDGNGVASNYGDNGEGQPVLISAVEGNIDGVAVAQNRIQVMQNIRSGNYETSEGEQMMIQERANNQIELRIGESRAASGLQIDSKDVEGRMVLVSKLSNGKDAEIKIMPNVASETALERLRLKNCVEEEGCKIELKEVGEGDNVRLAYEVKAEKQSRILGMFKKQMRVEAEVDAESGEVIRSGKPWWAFLASE